MQPEKPPPATPNTQLQSPRSLSLKTEAEMLFRQHESPTNSGDSSHPWSLSIIVLATPNESETATSQFSGEASTFFRVSSDVAALRQARSQSLEPSLPLGFLSLGRTLGIYGWNPKTLWIYEFGSFAKVTEIKLCQA